MVAGAIGGILGGIGSIAAAIIGAREQDKTNQYNWMTNIYNLRARERERREALDYANDVRDESRTLLDELRAEQEKLLQDQRLGATDAFGNTTKFVEGQGWVSEMSPEQRQLYDQYLQSMEGQQDLYNYFVENELPERRAQFDRRADASRQDFSTANALMQEFSRVYKDSPAEIEALLYEAATRGIGEGASDVTETAMRQAARTGNSNISNILSSIGRETMKARKDARADATLQGRDYVDEKFNSERGALAQLYNMFMSRAGQDVGASLDVTGVPQQQMAATAGAGQGANALMQLFSGLAQQGAGNRLSAGQSGLGVVSQIPQASMMRGGTLEKVDPNMAWANAAGAIGASLSGMGDRIGSTANQSNMNDLLRQYLTSGGQFDLGGGGIFGSAAERLRIGNGDF